TYWRGLYFFAEFSWNEKDIPLEKIESMFRKRFYGPKLGNTSHEFEDLLEKNLDYWAKALITSGNRRRNKNIKLVSLPKSEETGKWSKKYSAKIKGAQKAVNLYKKTRKRIEKDMRLADRGRYSLSYFN